MRACKLDTSTSWAAAAPERRAPARARGRGFSSESFQWPSRSSASCLRACAPHALCKPSSRPLLQSRERLPLRSDVSSYRACSIVRLLRIEKGGAYADVLSGDGEHTWERELDHVAETLGFRISPLTIRDRRQVTETVAGVTRWKRYLDFLIKSYYDANLYDQMEPLLSQILRIGVYELVKMETAPHAAISETVKLGKYALRQGAGNLVNGLLRSISRNKECGTLLVPKVQGENRSQARALADLHSHPVWMVRRWTSRFGKAETINLMEWNNKAPTYALRANSGRGYSREALLEKLRQAGVACEPSLILEDFVRVSGNMQAVIQSGFLQRGVCAVQDESGGLVVKVVDPQPGEIIVDCCAAPGGKALFIAACLKDEGKIIAIDKHKGKLKLLQEAARHFGVERVLTTHLSDLCSFVNTNSLLADKVLVDAPCSGLGVLSKRADLRWRKTAEDLGEMAKIQSNLLCAAARLVKPGGVLIYSTCSIEMEENEERVFEFLRQHTEFNLISVKGYVPSQFVTVDGFFAALPHQHFIDGAFAALLKRRAL